MSTQRTPGLVKVQHPHAGERGWEVAFEPGLEQLCQNVTEDKARRIAACWNACDGIDIEYLEGDESLPHYARRLLAQRDELLKALRGLHRVCMAMDLEAEFERPTEEAYLEATAAAAAAIAKVEGGAA